MIRSPVLPACLGGLRTAALLAALFAVGGLAAAGEPVRSAWPFTPLKRPEVPLVRHNSLVRNPVDAFILARLESGGLTLSPPADRATLLRRVTYDLTGLLPNPSDLDAFIHDSRPDAYERVVDRLLQSPAFGERWAQHWLDVVRFAESEGYKVDRLRPNAYRYRDYVIRAFNADLPYDRFLTQQIAGDEMAFDPDAVVATGFWRLHMEESNGSNYSRIRQDILDDNTDVLGSAVMGLTIGCARCHDHKFDPISQLDYYRLQAFLTPMVHRDDLSLVSLEDRARYQECLAAWDKEVGPLRKQAEEMMSQPAKDIFEELVASFDAETQRAMHAPVADRTAVQQQLCVLASKQVVLRQSRAYRRLPADRRAIFDDLQKKIAELEKRRPPEPATGMGVTDIGRDVPKTHRLAGGNYQRPREEVEPGFPKFLTTESPLIEPTAAHPESTGRRTALARWLCRKDHPLTARVMVNRLWQHYTGDGIIGTPNDFGAMGEHATHPELLDHLASELVENDWKLKAIHRLIVTSATYCQSSASERNTSEAIAMRLDPGNHLLWHMRVRRRDAESLRDITLQASGTLNRRMFGPSALPALPAPLNDARYAWVPDASEEQSNRRSVYVTVRRNMPYPLLAVFDTPDRLNSCAERAVTTSAPQALTLLNSDFMQTQARHMAGDLIQKFGVDTPALVRHLHQVAYNREPTRAEMAGSLQFLAEQSQLVTPAALGPLPEPRVHRVSPPLAASIVDLCHAVFNSAEFLYVD